VGHHILGEREGAPNEVQHFALFCGPTRLKYGGKPHEFVWPPAVVLGTQKVGERANLGASPRFSTG